MIPLQFTVLVLTVKIPALSQSPLTVSVLDPDIVKVAPDPIVMFFTSSSSGTNKTFY